MRNKANETQDEVLGRLVRAVDLPPEDAEFFLRIRELTMAAEEHRTRVPLHLIGHGRPIAIVALVAAVAGLVGGLVGAKAAESRALMPPPVLAFEVASGWNTLQTRLPPPVGDKVQIAWASNVPFAGDDPTTGFPLETAKTLSEDGVVVYASLSADVDNRDEYRELALPLSLSYGKVVSGDYENRPAPHVSLSTIGARVKDKYVLVHVWFGSNRPSAAARAAAEEQLRRLRVPN